MKNIVISVFLLFVLTGTALFCSIGDENNNDKKKSFRSENAASVNETEFFINNIKMPVYNNCLGPVNLNGAGFLWDGSGNPQINTIFVDGPLIGFKKDGEARVYGSKYDSGLIPGYIKDDGTYTTSDDSLSVIFQLTHDWEDLPEGDKKEFYRWNYENWPAEIGAPFIDHNRNGIYEPYIDQPEIKGNKTLWWTSHNLDSNITKSVSDSYGDKLEFHGSVWAYEKGIPDVLFRKYEVVNKNDYTLEDVFLSYWCDPDIGDGFDDFIGVDTTLSMAYGYNGDTEDTKFGDTPPAVGYKIINGPIVPGDPDDVAIINGIPVAGYKELLMTRFNMILKGVFRFDDLPLRSEKIYYRLAGYDSNGEQVLDPYTSQPTFFPLAGDPVWMTGWYEGIGWPNGHPPYDRRMIISSGPFDLAPGEKQSIEVAILNARGSNNLTSVEELKKLARNLHLYITSVDESTETPLPYVYKLNQNYPNPFNPATNISFSLPVASHVKLEVYDVLGKKVDELLNKELNAGEHSVKFDGEGLSSGIYIYRLTSGTMIQTKKMMLLK